MKVGLVRSPGRILDRRSLSPTRGGWMGTPCQRTGNEGHKDPGRGWNPLRGPPGQRGWDMAGVHRVSGHNYVQINSSASIITSIYVTLVTEQYVPHKWCRYILKNMPLLQARGTLHAQEYKVVLNSMRWMTSVASTARNYADYVLQQN